MMPQVGERRGYPLFTKDPVASTLRKTPKVDVVGAVWNAPNRPSCNEDSKLRAQHHRGVAGLASLVYGLALLVCAAAANAQASVYRCTAVDGSIEFRQRPCAEGAHSQALEIEDRRSGWVPPQPESQPPSKSAADRPARKAPKRAASGTRTNPASERCWKTRQQIERINNELRAGYKPARGERLKRRRREHEDYVNTFCR